MIDWDRVHARREELEETPFASEIAVFNPRTGRVCGFADVGMRIWTLLETPRSAREIEAVLLVEFDVDPALCRRELEAFLMQLLAEDLVVPLPAAPQAVA